MGLILSGPDMTLGGGGGTPTRASIRALLRDDLSLTSADPWTLTQGGTSATIGYATGPARLTSTVPAGVVDGANAVLDDIRPLGTDDFEVAARVKSVADSNTANEGVSVQLGTDDQNFLAVNATSNGSIYTGHVVANAWTLLITVTATSTIRTAFRAGTLWLFIRRTPTNLVASYGIGATLDDARAARVTIWRVETLATVLALGNGWHRFAGETYGSHASDFTAELRELSACLTGAV